MGLWWHTSVVRMLRPGGFPFDCREVIKNGPLQWRHNGRHVSNHQPYDCLLDRSFMAQINESIKAPRLPVNSPHKWPVTRKMFPFYDVIMLRNRVRQLVQVVGGLAAIISAEIFETSIKFMIWNLFYLLLNNACNNVMYLDAIYIISIKIYVL